MFTDLIDAHRLRVAEVAHALATDPRRGLSLAEAGRRLASVGRNELASERPVPVWQRFAAQFKDILVILLLVATAVSIAVWYYERDAALPYEAIAIFAVVLLNAAMGFIQEARAEAAVAALRAMSADAASAGLRARSGRPRDDRGRRHHSGRRSSGRIDVAADERGSADRRESSCIERH
jgi:Ca2+-transporting ATPase